MIPFSIRWLRYPKEHSCIYEILETFKIAGMTFKVTQGHW